MITFSQHYQKLRILKLPIVAVLLVLLWVGITGLVVLADISTKHNNLNKLYEIKRLNLGKIVIATKSTINFTSLDSTENLNQQKSQIENLKKDLYPKKLIEQYSNIYSQWPDLQKQFDQNQKKLATILDNNITVINLQLCQGNKIREINQLLLTISKTEIKPYSKAVIGELEKSFESIKSNLENTINLNRQLINCFRFAGSGFITQDNLYSMIKFGNNLSRINQIYNRIIETLKAEDRTGLASALDMIKQVDINNFVTLKTDFWSSLESGKDTNLSKKVEMLSIRQLEIAKFQAFLKSNMSPNFDR